MLTNEDLKTIEKAVEYLSTIGNIKAINICNDLVILHNKIVDYKRIVSKKSNKYNKEHRKQHNLLNSLYYYRKRGNQSKEKEILSRLERLKDTYD